MNKKIISGALFGLLSINSFAQDTSVPKFNQDLKVSAKIVPGCFLEAENINFGVLMMPISDTSAQSKISVKCSKNTPLNISIDGIKTSLDYQQLSSKYQTELKSNILTLEYRGYNESTKIHTYFIGRWSGGGVSTFTCGIGGTTNSPSDLVYQFFQAGVVGCNNDGSLANFSGKPYVGMQVSLLEHASAGGVVSGKSLTGLTSGEKIRYVVTKPNTTDVWVSNYTIVANGDTQEIPLKANIKRSENSSHRMTPDTYQDVLTIVLNY